MKSRTAKPTKSSTLFTTDLKKQGLKLVREEMDPALGLGPVFTITASKAGASNSDVAYRLYYASEVCKASAKHRKAVTKAKKMQCGSSVLGIGLIAAGGVREGLKFGLVDAEKKDQASGSESSSETSGSSVSGVHD